MEAFVEEFSINRNLDWIEGLGEYRILEASEDGLYDVAYNQTIVGFGVSDRDFVNLQFHSRLEDGSVYDMITEYPFEHPEDPKHSKRVRGKYLPSGTLIRPIPGQPNRCQYTFVNNFDLKGLLSRKIINMFSSVFMINYGKALIAKCKELNS